MEFSSQRNNAWKNLLLFLSISAVTEQKQKKIKWRAADISVFDGD